MSSEKELPRYVTIEEVCKMLSISRRTLERLQRLKTPDGFPSPCFYIGRSPRWEVNRLLDELKTNHSK